MPTPIVAAILAALGAYGTNKMGLWGGDDEAAGDPNVNALQQLQQLPGGGTTEDKQAVLKQIQEGLGVEGGQAEVPGPAGIMDMHDVEQNRIKTIARRLWAQQMASGQAPQEGGGPDIALQQALGLDKEYGSQEYLDLPSVGGHLAYMGKQRVGPLWELGYPDAPEDAAAAGEEPVTPASPPPPPMSKERALREGAIDFGGDVARSIPGGGIIAQIIELLGSGENPPAARFAEELRREPEGGPPPEEKEPAGIWKNYPGRAGYNPNPRGPSVPALLRRLKQALNPFD